jgi:predicted Zn-dependent peptidase
MAIDVSSERRADAPAADVATLAGGARVLTLPAGPQAMTLMVFVAAGSRYETRETAGTAHLLEHLSFSGTETRPSLAAVAAELDSIGCRFNAFTEKEYTGYFVRGAAEYAVPALPVLADVFARPALVDQDLERERRVVLGEMRMHEDNPRSLVRLLANRALYGDTPLGWDTAGFRDVVSRVTREDLLAFRRELYVGERVTFVFAGPFDHECCVGLAAEQLDGVKAGRAAPPPPAAYAPRVNLAVHRDTAQANLILALPGPSYRCSEREMLVARLVNSILGGSMSSRLFVSVRERQGLCYSIRSFLEPLSDAGGFFVFANTAPEEVSRTVASILGEVDRLVGEGVDEAEVAKAKAMTKGVYALEREESSSLARLSAFELLQRGVISSAAEKFELIDSISVEDVDAAARRYLRTGDLRVALVGPERAESALRESPLLPSDEWLDAAELLPSR